MADVLIKSVRIRPVGSINGVVDYKIELYKQRKEKYKVIAIPNGGRSLTYEYSMEYISSDKLLNFKNYIINNTDPVSFDKGYIYGFNINTLQDYDYFINDAVLKLGNHFEIIQDPWSVNPPTYRKYGFDPYYLNNGAVMYINWLNSDLLSIGGSEWSDDDGSELRVPRMGDEKVSIKYVSIISGSSDGNFYYTSGVEYFGKDYNWREFGGTFKDVDIINQVLTDWKMAINNIGYDIKVVGEKSNELEYISPFGNEIDETVKDEINKSSDGISTEIGKEIKKISLNIDIDGEYKVGKDMSFIINITDDFIFTDDQDLSLLSEEYIERAFDGEEEMTIELITEIVNNEKGDIIDVNEPSSVESIAVISQLNPAETLNELYNNAILVRQLKRPSSDRPNIKSIKSSYKKDLHGRCAMGVKSIASAIIGHDLYSGGDADSFSFGKPTRGNHDTFSNGGFYHTKIRPDDDYLYRKSGWKVGDIIACGYKGDKKWGHIQIWLGTHWSSDYVQGGGIMVAKSSMFKKGYGVYESTYVDKNSMALWRLTSLGMIQLRKYCPYLIKYIDVV